VRHLRSSHNIASTTFHISLHAKHGPDCEKVLIEDVHSDTQIPREILLEYLTNKRQEQ
jgi:hypothetical protein